MYDTPALRATEWVKPVQAGNEWFELSHIFTGDNDATFKWVRNGVKRLIMVSVVANGEAPAITIQNKTFKLEDGVARHIELKANPNMPVTLQCRGGTIWEVAAALREPDNIDHSNIEYPGIRVTVEAYLPRAGGNAFVLNSSRLDAGALDHPQAEPGTFILDKSQLDEDVLSRAVEPMAWRAISGPAKRVTIKQGVIAEGVTRKAEAGSLGIEAFNAMEPRALGLKYGTPIVCFDWIAREALFVGTVKDVTTTPHKGGDFTVNIEAVDLVGHLSAITRYGSVGYETQTWQDRANDLLQKHGIEWDYIPERDTWDVPMVPTVYESTLTQHLDLLADTQMGAWWVSPDGRVQICPGIPDWEPVAYFTDRNEHYPQYNTRYYTQADASFTTTDLITAVEVTNKTTKLSEEGKLEDQETVLPAVINKTAQATYGTRLGKVTVNTTPADAERIGKLLARNISPDLIVRKVTVLGMQENITVMEPVDTRIRGEYGHSLVVSKTHDFTPLKAITTFDLIPIPESESRNGTNLS